MQVCTEQICVYVHTALGMHPYVQVVCDPMQMPFAWNDEFTS